MPNGLTPAKHRSTDRPLQGETNRIGQHADPERPVDSFDWPPTPIEQR